MVQPPACGATEPPLSGRLIVENVDSEKWRVSLERRCERRVVGKPQVVSKPDDDRIGFQRNQDPSEILYESRLH
jgi:hypothetical protein